MKAGRYRHFLLTSLFLGFSCFIEEGWTAFGEKEDAAVSRTLPLSARKGLLILLEPGEVSSEEEMPQRARSERDWSTQAVVGPHEEREWAEIFKDMERDIRLIQQKLGGMLLNEGGLHEQVEDLHGLVGAVDRKKTISDVLEELLARINEHLEKAAEESRDATPIDMPEEGRCLVMRFPLPSGKSLVPPLETVAQLVDLLRKGKVSYE